MSKHSAYKIIDKSSDQIIETNSILSISAFKVKSTFLRCKLQRRRLNLLGGGIFNNVRKQTFQLLFLHKLKGLHLFYPLDLLL